MNIRMVWAACAAATFFSVEVEAQVNLSPGDLAIIGYRDLGPGTEDIFTVVTFVNLPAGTIIYFTDNGWDGRKYYKSDLDGNGGEQLLKFTANAMIPKGAVIGTDTADASYTWTKSGAVPFGGDGSFSTLALSENGDQVNIFQSASENNPLINASMHIYVIDDSGAFEPAINSNTGAIPPGLSVAASTAVTFDQKGTSDHFMGFNINALTAGTKQEWLAAIADEENWTFAFSGSQPTGSIVVIDGGCPDADGDLICDADDVCALGDDLADCDDDGIADACAIDEGIVMDVNLDGVPDTCECAADLTGDGQVDGADLGLLLSEWLTGSLADLSGDSQVDGADLGLLLVAWGACG